MSGLEGTAEENTAKRPRVKTSTVVGWSIIGLIVGALAALDIAFYFKLPPVLRGIAPGYIFVRGESKPSQARAALDRRLVATFPVGTKEDALVERLTAEGFKGPFPGPAARGRCALGKSLRYTVSYINTLFPWRWYVCWSADQAGTVTEIGVWAGPSK